MGWITWILFGLIAGALAKMIMPANQNMGWLMTIIVGIVGAFVGGAIGVYLLNWGDVDSFGILEVDSCYWRSITCAFYFCKTNKRKILITIFNKNLNHAYY